MHTSTAIRGLRKMPKYKAKILLDQLEDGCQLRSARSIAAGGTGAGSHVPVEFYKDSTLILRKSYDILATLRNFKVIDGRHLFDEIKIEIERLRAVDECVDMLRKSAKGEDVNVLEINEFGNPIE